MRNFCRVSMNRRSRINDCAARCWPSHLGNRELKPLESRTENDYAFASGAIAPAVSVGRFQRNMADSIPVVVLKLYRNPEDQIAIDRMGANGMYCSDLNGACCWNPNGRTFSSP